MNIGTDIPEGLTLQLTPGEEPALFDAGDVCWVIFTDGGSGDPKSWQANIIEATCDVLGVTEAFDSEGEEMDVDEFISWYVGEAAFNE